MSDEIEDTVQCEGLIPMAEKYNYVPVESGVTRKLMNTISKLKAKPGWHPGFFYDRDSDEWLPLTDPRARKWAQSIGLVRPEDEI